MRIGYLVPEWPGQTHAFFWRELTALRELGHSVFPFSTKHPPDDACLHGFASEARETTHYLFPPRTLATARILAARPKGTASALAYAASLTESSLVDRAKVAALLACAADLTAKCEELAIDHLHVHSCANAAHIAAMADLLGGPGYSLTLHGDLPVYGTDHRQKMKRARFVSVVTRPLQKQVIAATDLTEERVPVVWMGVDTERFTPGPDRAGKTGPFSMVTVARLNAAKGHAYALAALKRVRDSGLDVRYTIAGEGPHRAEIERAVAELGLADAVDLPGTRSESEVLALLQGTDAFILPSVGLGEAAPVSVMEAMSCGLPVICSRIGGTEDMISDGETGLLTAQKDVDGLARAIETLVRDPGLRHELGRNAREHARRTFDYRATAGKLAEAFARR
jgi:colanic acid/amylovoran biosynthesis glycosyltransferase